jgi:hypothetical protein
VLNITFTRGECDALILKLAGNVPAGVSVWVISNDIDVRVLSLPSKSEIHFVLDTNRVVLLSAHRAAWRAASESLFDNPPTDAQINIMANAIYFSGRTDTTDAMLKRCAIKGTINALLAEPNKDRRRALVAYVDARANDTNSFSIVERADFAPTLGNTIGTLVDSKMRPLAKNDRGSARAQLELFRKSTQAATNDDRYTSVTLANASDAFNNCPNTAAIMSYWLVNARATPPSSYTVSDQPARNEITLLPPRAVATASGALSPTTTSSSSAAIVTSLDTAARHAALPTVAVDVDAINLYIGPATVGDGSHAAFTTAVVRGGTARTRHKTARNVHKRYALPNDVKVGHMRDWAELVNVEQNGGNIDVTIDMRRARSHSLAGFGLAMGSCSIVLRRDHRSVKLNGDGNGRLKTASELYMIRTETYRATKVPSGDYKLIAVANSGVLRGAEHELTQVFVRATVSAISTRVCIGSQSVVLDSAEKGAKALECKATGVLTLGTTYTRNSKVQLFDEDGKVLQDGHASRLRPTGVWLQLVEAIDEPRSLNNDKPLDIAGVDQLPPTVGVPQAELLVQAALADALDIAGVDQLPPTVGVPQAERLVQAALADAPDIAGVDQLPPTVGVPQAELLVQAALADALDIAGVDQLPPTVGVPQAERLVQAALADAPDIAGVDQLPPTVGVPQAELLVQAALADALDIAGVDQLPPTVGVPQAELLVQAALADALDIAGVDQLPPTVGVPQAERLVQAALADAPDIAGVDQLPPTVGVPQAERLVQAALADALDIAGVDQLPPTVGVPQAELLVQAALATRSTSPAAAADRGRAAGRCARRARHRRCRPAAADRRRAAGRAAGAGGARRRAGVDQLPPTVGVPRPSWCRRRSPTGVDQLDRACRRPSCWCRRRSPTRSTSPVSTSCRRPSACRRPRRRSIYCRCRFSATSVCRSRRVATSATTTPHRCRRGADSTRRRAAAWATTRSCRSRSTRSCHRLPTILACRSSASCCSPKRRSRRRSCHSPSARSTSRSSSRCHRRRRRRRHISRRRRRRRCCCRWRRRPSPRRQSTLRCRLSPASRST